jgi:GT2 family glycosyltransferase
VRFLSSLKKSLKFSGYRGEIIIIDDKSASYNRNLGVIRSRGDIIIFVDDDVKLKRDSIFKIINFYKKWKGIVQGRIIGIYGCGDFRGNFIRPFLRWKVHEKIISSSAATSFSLFPKEVFKKGVFFDDKLFPWEDVDICMRAKKKGFKVFYCKSAVAYHFSKCKYRRFNKYWFLEKLARLRFILKHIDIFLFGDYLTKQ